MHLKTEDFARQRKQGTKGYSILQLDAAEAHTSKNADIRPSARDARTHALKAPQKTRIFERPQINYFYLSRKPNLIESWGERLPGFR